MDSKSCHTLTEAPSIPRRNPRTLLAHFVGKNPTLSHYQLPGSNWAFLEQNHPQTGWMRSHPGSLVSSLGNPRPANRRPPPLRSVTACACIPASRKGCRRAGGSPPEPLPVHPEPSPGQSLNPRHLWDRPQPDPGASSPEDIEGGAGNQAPQAASGQCARAWRGRVGQEVASVPSACCDPTPFVPVYTCW